MWTAIKFLVLAAVVIAAAWWMMHLPGSVSAQIGDTTLGAPTPVALLAVIVLFIVLYVLVRLLAGLLRLPGRSARMRSERNRRNGEAAVTRTLIALAGGDAAAAQREAERSRKLLGDTPQTLLFAAYAGRQAGQPERAEAAFKLLAARDDAAFLGLRGLLQQAVANGNVDRATDLARQAEAANPGAAWLQTERANLAIRAGNWKEALALSPASDTRAALASAAADAEADPAEARRLAKRAWDIDPAFTPAALAYARRLREAGRESRAQEVLRTSWGRKPHPDLAAASMANDADPAARLRRAEWLVKPSPGQAEGELLLARAHLDAGNGEQALQHLAAARAAGLVEHRVWMLAGEIARATNNADAEAEALQQAAAAEPDTVWRCGQCGGAHTAWHPVCSLCGTPGRIAWGRIDAGAGTRTLVAGGEPILP